MSEPTKQTRRSQAATIADLLRYRLIIKQLPLTRALNKPPAADHARR